MVINIVFCARTLFPLYHINACNVLLLLYLLFHYTVSQKKRPNFKTV